MKKPTSSRFLTPQADFTFSFLPSSIVYTLLLDGTKREISFPYPEGEKGNREWPPAMADTGKSNPVKMGYYLDAFWLQN